MVPRLSLFFVLLTLIVVCGTTPAAPGPTDVPVADATHAPHTCPTGLRTIAGAFGSSCIPMAPERIIVLNEGMMANLLALGVPPSGSNALFALDFRLRRKFGTKNRPGTALPHGKRLSDHTTA